MNVHRTLSIIIVVSLLLLSTLTVLSPSSSGKYVEGEQEFIEIEKDDHWVKLIKKPSEKDEPWKYTIYVAEEDGATFDVYLLESHEYDKYKDGTDFKADIFKEGLKIQNETYITINITLYEKDPDFYFVVDNMDNVHANDAYANETIMVAITVDYEIKDEGGWVCLVICLLPVIIIILFIIAIVLGRRDQTKTNKYQKMMRSPAFQPLRPNPYLRPPYRKPSTKYPPKTME